MILLSKIRQCGTHRKLIRSLCLLARSSRRSVGTINYDRSLEHGFLIPDISLDDVGVSSVIGARKHQEDRYVVQTLKNGSLLLGVFDGHGGSLAATYTQKHLPSLLEKALEQQEDSKTNISMADVMEKAFLDVNANLLDYVRKGKAGESRMYANTQLWQ